MFFCFFVIDTASTRSYTYCPTPSLHAALPHSLEMGDQPPRAAAWQGIFLVESEGVVMARQHRSQCFQRRIVGDAGAQPGGPMGRTPAGEAALRSDEHTSELQLLMRISYAVFCLKKKKTNTHTEITER